MTTTLNRTSLSSLPRCSYDGELKRAIEIADHYGFRLIDQLPIEKSDREHAEHYNCPHEHATLMRLAGSDDISRSSNTLLLAHTHKVPYKNKLEFRLEVVGDRESSAEGLLLQTSRAILKEYGHDDTLVTVNSVGGRETSSTFVQAMSSYIRSHINDLDPECRDGIRTSIFAPLRCSHGACIEARAQAPQSLNFLSEPSRQHFKEVLEYLESLEMPYVVDPSLVGNEHYTTRTVFAIGTPAPVATDETTSGPLLSTVLARGERYDQLAKKMGMKRPIPAVHVTFDLGTKTTRERLIPKATNQEPSVYIVQVGLPAKIRVLSMNEELRKSRIRVSVTLHKQSVTEQMDHAQAIGTQCIVIIGHKEVRDGAALVRQVATNHQETVPFCHLPSYLKSIYATRKR